MTDPSLERITAKEYALYKADQTPFGTRLFRSSVLSAFGAISSVVRSFTSEHFSVEGFDETFVQEGAVKPPYLLLVQHTTWYDFSNIFPLWFAFPEGHIFNAVTRRDYFPKIPTLNAITNALASAVSLPVYGVSSTGTDSAHERERRMRINKEVEQQVIAAYAKGISVALAPEGTTKGNGAISRIRAGAYHYSHFAEDEIRYSIPCVPLGVTYDFLSGKERNGKRKQRVFARVGQPFFYTPVSEVEGEGVVAYQHRDKEAFNQQIKDAYIDLNTITAAQLASVFIYEKLEKRERTTTFGEFQAKIHYMAQNAQEIFGIGMDPLLLDESERGARLFSLYHALIKEGYFAPANNGHHSICESRAQREPDIAVFKKENVLLHTYNKIAEVMEERPQIRDAIRSVR